MTPREIDALVAEKVMGRRLRQPGEKYEQFKFYYATRSGLLVMDDGFPNTDPTFHPSTDIAAAWQVVEEMGGGNSVILSWRPMTGPSDGFLKKAGKWHCVIGLTEVIAATAPLAICLAALKAVEAR